MEEEFTLMVVLAWFFPTHWLLLFKFVDFGESCRVQKKTTLFWGKSIADGERGSLLILGRFIAHEHLPTSTLHVLVEDAKLQAKSKQTLPCVIIIW